MALCARVIRHAQILVDAGLAVRARSSHTVVWLTVFTGQIVAVVATRALIFTRSIVLLKTCSASGALSRRFALERLATSGRRVQNVPRIALTACCIARSIYLIDAVRTRVTDGVRIATVWDTVDSLQEVTRVTRRACRARHTIFRVDARLATRLFRRHATMRFARTVIIKLIAVMT